MSGRQDLLPAIDPEAGVGSGYLAEVIAAACDMALLISPDGRISSVIAAAEQAGDERLAAMEGARIADVLTDESLPKFDAARIRIADGQPVPRPIELNHLVAGGIEVPVRYSFLPFGTDGTFLMLGRDLSTVAETQAQLVQAQMSLEQGYEARREFDARYRLLLRTVHDPIVFVSHADGTIDDLNEPAAALLGGTREAMLGLVLAQCFAGTDKAQLLETLSASSDGGGTRPARLVVERTGRPVDITGQLFRAAGTRTLVCRLGAADAEGAAPAGLSLDLGAMFEKSSDAMVFTSLKGEIQSCNDAFLDLVNAGHMSDVKGESLATYLGRGRIDLNVIVENARRAGQMRLYATKVVTGLGGDTSVEMSVSYLNDRTEPVLGFVIRDASRSEAVRNAQIHGAADSARSVMELVGSSTLKEIVAETTDVVEKMCIETAVHLTRNNRVAAAEMLGLSRQSLYVKLRKYGLLHRDAGADE